MDRTRLTGPLAQFVDSRSSFGERAPKSREAMARQNRTDDWGFPRWRSYGDKGRSAARIRLCDREGCNEVGDRPAPKAPNSRERWYFCEAHAAEYNKNWNYFAGLTAEEAARRAAEGRMSAQQQLELKLPSHAASVAEARARVLDAVGPALAAFELGKHLSANRTQGVPNMIALVKETADRYAAAA